MSKTLLKPIDTGGTMIPWLEYRTMQHEACIMDYFARADEEMEQAAQAVEERAFGVVCDHVRKAHKKLSIIMEMGKAHKELKWVQQHPKLNQ
jgi:hypothetical protein